MGQPSSRWLGTEETSFNSIMLYYNTQRPHQALDGKTPLETLQSI